MAWSTHTPVQCAICGELRPRTWSVTHRGKVHKRCLERAERAERAPRPAKA